MRLRSLLDEIHHELAPVVAQLRPRSSLGAAGEFLRGEPAPLEHFKTPFILGFTPEVLRAPNKKRRPIESHTRGMTLIEVMVVVSVSIIVLTVLIRFLATGHPVSQVTLLQARSSETARIQLERIARALREARESDTGGYHLVDMSPQRIIFYSDIDGDVTVERVRYELVGTSLERGLVEPSGVPPMYDTGTEQVTTVGTHVVNGTDDLFTYYSGDYPTDTTPLTPVDLTEVKYIQFRLLIDADPLADPPPIEVISQVQLRNLKTNLGD